MTIRRYVLVDPRGDEVSSEYTSFERATTDAARLRYAVVERTYTFEDSELVWTPDGGSEWPPKEGAS